MAERIVIGELKILGRQRPRIKFQSTPSSESNGPWEPLAWASSFKLHSCVTSRELCPSPGSGVRLCVQCSHVLQLCRSTDILYLWDGCALTIDVGLWPKHKVGTTNVFHLVRHGCHLEEQANSLGKKICGRKIVYLACAQTGLEHRIFLPSIFLPVWSACRRQSLESPAGCINTATRAVVVRVNICESFRSVK